MGLPSVSARRKLPHEGGRRRPRGRDPARSHRRPGHLSLGAQPHVPRPSRLPRRRGPGARLVDRGGGVRVPPALVPAARAGRRAPPREALRGALSRLLPTREALGAGRPLTSAVPMMGDALAFASATCFAISNVTIARGARPEAEDNGAFVSLVITTVISGALWLALGLARGFEPVTGRALLWFAGAGVFTAFVGRVFFYASVQRLGAMRSSTLKRLNPFFAVLLGVAVLHEQLSGGMTIGLALLAASFAMLMAGARGNAARPAGADGGSFVARFGYAYGIVS